MVGVNLVEQLRRETKAAHRSLDQHPRLRSFTSSRTDLKAYHESLRAMYRAWAPFETDVEQRLSQIIESKTLTTEHRAFFHLCLKNFSSRRYALESDLQKLGGQSASSAVTSGFSDNAGSQGASALVGALYVCFGAQLGSRVIAGSLARNLTGAPTEFFLTTHPNLRGFWGEFIASANRLNMSDEERRETIDAAIRAFLTIEAALY